MIRRAGLNPELFAIVAPGEFDERTHRARAEALSAKARADAEPSNPADGFAVGCVVNCPQIFEFGG